MHPYKEQWLWEERGRTAHVMAWFLGQYPSSKNYRFKSSPADARMECECFAWILGNVLLRNYVTLPRLISNPKPWGALVPASYLTLKFAFSLRSLDGLFVASVFSGINSSALLIMEEFDCCVCSLPVLKGGIQLRIKTRFAVYRKVSACMAGV